MSNQNLEHSYASHRLFIMTRPKSATLRMMSPSCKLPSREASPVLVISLMKIWLPRRRPYSVPKRGKEKERER